MNNTTQWRIKEFTNTEGKKLFKIQRKRFLLFWIYESQEYYGFDVCLRFETFNECINHIRSEIDYETKISFKQTNIIELDNETVMEMNTDKCY